MHGEFKEATDLALDIINIDHFVRPGLAAHTAVDNLNRLFDVSVKVQIKTKIKK